MYVANIADSSKQRSKLHSKNLSEKKKLEELVKQYNFINNMLKEGENALTYAQALAGSLPWITKDEGRGTCNIVDHILLTC